MNIHELIRHLNHGQRQGDGTTILVGRHAVTEAIRLLNLLGETNEALAACQSEGAAWRRKAEEISDRLAIANSSNSDLREERDTLTDRLAEAMRLLAKEGIHMDDHGCWCNPTVIDYSDSKVKHE